MTQHEYIFVTVSIVIGLAITRLLHLVGDLIRYHESVKFHWSSVIWGVSVLIFSAFFDFDLCRNLYIRCSRNGIA
jgi:hypothetical protein